MSVSLRSYLLNELGVDESKELMNISKFIRTNTRLEKEDKADCCVCHVPCFEKGKKGGEMIYNHHVMKVEYLAILADKYGMVYTKKTKDKDKLSVKDYEFAPGFEIYSPRVAVCNDHHTMFHELVGDNPLKLVYDIDPKSAKNIVEVFDGFNDEVRSYCQVDSHDPNNLLGYKRTYQAIWDETMLKSLVRLGYSLRLNELKSQTNELSILYNPGDTARYGKVIDTIDDIVARTVNMDEELGIVLPDIDVFEPEELEKIENELMRYEVALKKEGKISEDEFLGGEAYDLSDVDLDTLEEILLEELDEDEREA